MKIEKGEITILRISDVPRLDPIRVTLDDLGPGKGRINIECYGKAWVGYWEEMGAKRLAQFVVGCDNDFLRRHLAADLRETLLNGDVLYLDAKRVISDRRKGASEWGHARLTEDQAETLMDCVGVLVDCTGESALWEHGALLEAIYGEGWLSVVRVRGEGSNPAWGYLGRILDAVKEALRATADTAMPKPEVAAA